MALLSPLQIEVRTTGSDSNGGGFDATSGTPGTDYSLQDAAQVAYTDLVIDAVTNTNCTSVATPFTAAHVGNLINITAGTGFTVQRVQIISVTGVIATCDKSLGTTGSTGGTGNLGGGLKTIGTAGLLPLVAGNTIWIKYHASNVYSSTSSTANVANGRLSLSVGTATLPLSVRGYDVTHGDNTGNRPTLRWGVNAGSNPLIGTTGVVTIRSNLIYDGNRANFTSTRGDNPSGNCTVDNCKFMGFSAVALLCSGGTKFIVGCEFTDCVTSAAVNLNTAAAEVELIDCYIHDCTAGGFINNQTARAAFYGCVFDTITGIGADMGASITDGPTVVNSVFYNCSTDGLKLGVEPGIAQIINTVFETNGAYGLNTAGTGLHEGVFMHNCAFYNNTTNKYDTTKIMSMNVSGEIINTTGTFFTDAPNQNFAPNSTANQGALIRAVGYPTTLPGSASTTYLDVGAIQHQDTGGSSTTFIYNVME